MYKRKPKLDKEIQAYLATLKNNKTDNTKKQVIEGLLDSVTRNPGAYGCIMEIMCGGSRKKFVAAEGKPDMYFYFNGVRLQAECKTSGGRIGSLLYGDNKAKFIVYSMDVCNTGTSGKLRHIDPVIMPVKMFIDLLIDCNAVKAINKGGVFDDWGIQVTSKELYLRLSEYPISFFPGAHYTEADFDGLEV